ncbi:PREDICTED: solute carrier family 22 member 18-like isoform X2 [Branchiostoma belcheri]|nr:PREDICTED: solute carrier family 22 member 18-like isoform X2 [Branchiostoma belcheri]
MHSSTTVAVITQKHGLPNKPEEEYRWWCQIGAGDRRRLLTIVHVSNALHHMCLMMNNGALPYLAKRLNISNSHWGHLITIVAFLEIIGGPLGGRFGDVYGGRLSLTLSCAAMATTAAMLSTCNSFQSLVLSKFPLVFSHVSTGLHMVISDITDDASRSTELGTLRLSTTFGNMVGSAVGGILTEKYGTTMTFLCTAMLSAVSALLVWIYIPVQTKQHGDNNLPTTILPELCEGSGEDQQEDCRFPESSTLQSTLPQERKIVNFQKITRLLKIPAVAHLLGIKFALILANKIVLNAFPIILRDTYGMGPQEAGMFTMYCSIASAVLQMGLIRPLTRRYKDFPLMMLSSLVLTTSYVIATCMTERWHIYVFAVFKSFGVIMTNTVVVSALSKASPPEDTGAVMGLLAMFVSLGKVVSPPISTYVLDHVGYQFLGVTSAAMTTVVAGFIRLTKEEFR